MSPLSSDVQLDCDVCLSLIERHPKGWTFFLFGKWYYMRHLKQRKEARYARNVGDGRSYGPGVLDVSRH